MSSPLRGSDDPLSRRYDVAMLDLDGVVYVGPDAVPGVPGSLRQARADGLRLAFVTNNAARPPSAVAEHLVELGIDATPEEVITSSQAAARYLADRLPAGASVLVLGTTGLIEALTERGLVPVADTSGQVDAVVQGFSPAMDWKLLSEGAVAINRGLLWVATNADPTVPSPRGPLPGNGSLVMALRHATRKDPVVTGKPDPTMHRETVIRTGASAPLVVGDRLDTDIEGANAVGCDSMIVFSGVTTLRDLLGAVPVHRPTYIAQDLSGILLPQPQPDIESSSATCGRWSAALDGTGLTLRTLSVPDDAGSDAGSDAPSARDERLASVTGSALDGSAFDSDQLDAIRALCAAAWAGSDAPSSEVAVSGADHDAAAMVTGLGLS